MYLPNFNIMAMIETVLERDGRCEDNRDGTRITDKERRLIE